MLFLNSLITRIYLKTYAEKYMQIMATGYGLHSPLHCKTLPLVFREFRLLAQFSQ